MTPDMRPRLRKVESFPVNQAEGQVVFALRDPEGFAGSILIPYPAAFLASLMDGDRTLADLQTEFQRRFGQPVALADVERLVAELDQRLFLENGAFRARWKSEVEAFLNSKVRPAAHAGGAYAEEPEDLLKQLDALFLPPEGPGFPARLGTSGKTPAEAPMERLREPMARTRPGDWSACSAHTSICIAAGRPSPGPISGWSTTAMPICS